jgi:hypothetical protein
MFVQWLYYSVIWTFVNNSLCVVIRNISTAIILPKQNEKKNHSYTPTKNTISNK